MIGRFTSKHCNLQSHVVIFAGLLNCKDLWGTNAFFLHVSNPRIARAAKTLNPFKPPRHQMPTIQTADSFQLLWVMMNSSSNLPSVQKYKNIQPCACSVSFHGSATSIWSTISESFMLFFVAPNFSMHYALRICAAAVVQNAQFVFNTLTKNMTHGPGGRPKKYKQTHACFYIDIDAFVS